VAVDLDLIDLGRLVVEKGGDRFAYDSAFHVRVVGRSEIFVPEVVLLPYVRHVDSLTHAAMLARAGDHEGVETFVRLAHDSVWRFCAGLVDAQSADDLAQETLLQAVRSLPRFEGRSTARTWVLAIARKVCLEEIRQRARAARNLRVATEAAQARPDTTPDVAETVGVRDLLARLDPDRRSAFVLTQLLRLSYDEAAEICGCPAGTIRSRVSRSRVDLITMLGMAREQRRAN
jgi:RNA polymerase sigma-70 factor (ECF subfamily)